MMMMGDETNMDENLVGKKAIVIVEPGGHSLSLRNAADTEPEGSVC